MSASSITARDMTKIALCVAFCCVTAYISFPLPFTPGMVTALTLALGREYTYALYCPTESAADGWVRELLRLQGFVSVPKDCGHGVLAVDMRRPIILSNNVNTTVKPPLSTAPSAW